MTHATGKEGKNGNPTEGNNAGMRPVVTFDAARYEHFLEEMDLTDEQKRALLEALWSIIVGFVDLGFGVHPVQQSCGQNAQDDSATAGQGDDAVCLKDGHSPQIIQGTAVVLNAAGESES